MPVSQKLLEVVSTDHAVQNSTVENGVGEKWSSESLVGAGILRATMEGRLLLGSAALPMKMSYVPHRQNSGTTKLFAAGFFTILGLFLITNASGPSWLPVDTVILGGLGLVAAFSFAISAWRDLKGKLHVSEEGISVSPFWWGFQVRWGELESWKVNRVQMGGETMYQLLLWTREEKCPLMFPIDWVSSDHQSFLLSVLEKKLPRYTPPAVI